MNPPRRNEPCPCGSGQKYKKCCAALQNDSQNDEIIRTRATAYKMMSEENWLEALDLFKSILDKVDTPVPILKAMAACYDGLEDYLMASEFYEKALSACPDSIRPELLYHLGVARACGQRIDKAIAAFSECIDYLTDTAQKNHVSQILQMLGQIQEGNKPLNSFLIQVQLQRAFNDMETEKYSSAAERLEKLSTIDPDNPVIYYNLGVVYTFLKREDEAISRFEAAVRIYPGYYQAWYNLGQISLIRKKDFSRAFHCFDRAAAIRPDYVGAHHQRGVACELLGDKEAALKCYEKTLELEPENKQALDSVRRLGAISDSDNPI